MAETPSIELWRVGIGTLARWACGMPLALTRSKLDPVYVEVTEGRDKRGSWRYYSSCADLGHWLAKRVGVRAQWVNRDDDHFAGPWEPIKNVGKLGSPSIHPPVGWLPEEGDILILSNHSWPSGDDYHVCVYLGPNQDAPGEHYAANYGAAGLADTPIGGARISSKPLRVELSALRYGSKKISRVITVPMLVAMRNAPADFSGPGWDDRFTGEVRDALEAS